MIGDSWEADILGAMNFGMDQVYYNAKIEKKELLGRFFKADNRKIGDILEETPSFLDGNLKNSGPGSVKTAIISHLHQLIDIL